MYVSDLLYSETNGSGRWKTEANFHSTDKKDTLRDSSTNPTYLLTIPSVILLVTKERFLNNAIYRQTTLLLKPQSPLTQTHSKRQCLRRNLFSIHLTLNEVPQ